MWFISLIFVGWFGGGCDLGGPLMWSRIFWIMSGSVISAMTCIVPPHKEHRVMWSRSRSVQRLFWAVRRRDFEPMLKLQQVHPDSLVLQPMYVCVLLSCSTFTLFVLFGTISFLSFELGWWQPRAKKSWYRTSSNGGWVVLMGTIRFLWIPIMGWKFTHVTGLERLFHTASTTNRLFR